jgi:hypothetical protein
MLSPNNYSNTTKRPNCIEKERQEKEGQKDEVRDAAPRRMYCMCGDNRDLWILSSLR